ncbi:MAG: hypothetical protein ABIR30_11450 [Chitinophagaceae bacterium]
MDPNKYITTNRAALFDWLVLLISFLLGFIFPGFIDIISSPGFYNWMLAALLFYIVGAALKHLPLSYRLSHFGKEVKPIPYLICLIIGHWFIILILVFFSEAAIRRLLHLQKLDGTNSGGGPIIIGSIVTATFVTWLVYRAKSHRKKRKVYSASFLFRMELAADILLVASVAIFSFVFWEKGVMAMLGNASTKTLANVWFLFVLLCILFLFFYLPLRYLFFMENREGHGNRKRLIVIFAFMLIKASLEFLGI